MPHSFIWYAYGAWLGPNLITNLITVDAAEKYFTKGTQDLVDCHQNYHFDWKHSYGDQGVVLCPMRV